MKRLDQFMNAVIGACLGFFTGTVLFRLIHWLTHQEQYAMRSTPWYTDIVVWGVIAALVALAAVGVKLILRCLRK